MNDEMRLMLYLDGLLDGEELERFEARLAVDETLSKALRAHRISGAYLRGEVSAALEERSFEALHDSVCASLEFSEKSQGTSASAPKLALGDWFAEFAAAWRAPLLSGLAAATVTFLILRPPLMEASSDAPVAVELEEVRNPGGRMVLIRQPAEDEASPVIWLLEEETGEEEEEVEGDATGASNASKAESEQRPAQSTSPPQPEE